MARLTGLADPRSVTVRVTLLMLFVPVEALDGDRVPWAQLVQEGVELRSVLKLAGGLVDEDPCAAGRS